MSTDWLSFVVGFATGTLIFLGCLLLDDPIQTGRIQVASGQYECAQDIAGEWRCRAQKRGSRAVGGK